MKVGGLLNATCGNATELIIAIFALNGNKLAVVKYFLLGSILSNLLLVLGTSLFCGGIANISQTQKYDRRQADVNSLMLLLALLCHMLPMLFRYATSSTALAADPSLQLSRASTIVMLIAYFAHKFILLLKSWDVTAHLVFQLWTHRQFFKAQDEDDNDDSVSEEAVIGFWSGFSWLAGMTVFIALLSKYVVETIEDASESWGLSVSFLSIILLPIVGNAVEHAGAIIFAFKNNLDISLGVALGSAIQISLFVVPLCVIISWIMGNKMDLNFNPVETGSLALAIIATAFTLQDGTSHSMKGFILLLCYVVIGACFFEVDDGGTQQGKIQNGVGNGRRVVNGRPGQVGADGTWEILSEGLEVKDPSAPLNNDLERPLKSMGSVDVEVDSSLEVIGRDVVKNAVRELVLQEDSLARGEGHKDGPTMMDEGLPCAEKVASQSVDRRSKGKECGVEEATSGESSDQVNSDQSGGGSLLGDTIGSIVKNGEKKKKCRPVRSGKSKVNVGSSGKAVQVRDSPVPSAQL
ncbi:hypothetical protein K1719_002597 [Acacia pycnantha]|nr:hypothetical protein K1719_002597 [Acacia pycnantha]